MAVFRRHWEGTGQCQAHVARGDHPAPRFPLQDSPWGSATDSVGVLSRDPHRARGFRFSQNASPQPWDKLFANLLPDKRETGRGCSVPGPAALLKAHFLKSVRVFKASISPFAFTEKIQRSACSSYTW